MKLKNIIILGLATTALTACDDLFEPALENNQDITEMYNLPTFARGIIDNAFLTIPYDAEFNSDYCTDVATDDAVSNDNDKDYKKMAMGTWTSQNNPMNQWENRYHAIQYCNLFLENCDQVQWDYSSEALNQMHGDLYKGQAYALRGIHFFFLLRAHSGKVNGEILGQPIHTSSEDGSSDFNQARPPFKECIDQIIADFDEALKYVPTEYGDVGPSNVPAKYTAIGGTDTEYNKAFGTHQRGKIDGRMIAAFKAQVALFAASPAYASAGAMTWDKAAEYAAASLKNVGGLAGVDPKGWTWYCNKDVIDTYDFTKPDPLEICWRGNVSESTTTIESNNYPPSLKGKGRINPTQNLVDAFPMANGYPIKDGNSGYDPANPYANRDPRLKAYILVNGETQGAHDDVINTAADNRETLDGLNRENGQSTQTGYYLRKHTRADVNLNPATGKKHFGARIRYTEIFLAYAEAANEAQGPQAKVGGANYSAYDVIKALRARVHQGEDWADPYLESIKNDQGKMRELIRNERRLELCFENHRFWDLRRWQANLTETAKGVSITTNTAGVHEYKYIDVEPRNYQDYMIYGPVPYSEVLKWSNLLQNDGWR